MEAPVEHEPPALQLLRPARDARRPRGRDRAHDRLPVVRAQVVPGLARGLRDAEVQGMFFDMITYSYLAGVAIVLGGIMICVRRSGTAIAARDLPCALGLALLWPIVSVYVFYPFLLAYVSLHMYMVVLTYSLVVLTTVVLYLLACDPLPPCTGKVTEWLRALASSRTAVRAQDNKVAETRNVRERSSRRS